MLTADSKRSKASREDTERIYNPQSRPGRLACYHWSSIKTPLIIQRTAFRKMSSNVVGQGRPAQGEAHSFCSRQLFVSGATGIFLIFITALITINAYECVHHSSLELDNLLWDSLQVNERAFGFISMQLTPELHSCVLNSDIYWME